MPFLPAIAAIAATAASVKQMQDSDNNRKDAAEQNKRNAAAAAGISEYAQAQQAKQQAMIDQMTQASPDIFKQQQAYANTLQQQMQGQGPNPAMAALNQRTGQNVANQAALMAGQRGAGANVGLMARQAAMQGADIQQNAIGQGATLQAQQQLAASGQYGQQANQIAAQQIQAQQSLGQQALGSQGAMLQANAAQQATNAEYAKQANQANMQKFDLYSDTALGGLKGLGVNLVSSPGKAHGGMIDHNYSDGGIVNFMMNNMQAGGDVPGHAQMAGDHAKNDTVPAMLSPGEIVIPRSVVNSSNAPADAAKFVAAVLAKKGMR